MAHSKVVPQRPEADDVPKLENLAITDDNTNEEAEDNHEADSASVASEESEMSVMEPFEEYKNKIERLLDDIGFRDYEVDAIQHGFEFMNCVYSLTTSANTDQYILRVATGGFYRKSSGHHEDVENEVLVLAYLRDKLPVPRVKAYSLTADNPLEMAYTIQTRIPGQSLNKLWATMGADDKHGVVNELVDLLVQLESVTFATAGTFATSAPLPGKALDFSSVEDPLVNIFDAYTIEPTKDERLIKDRAGPDLKLLLTTHMERWIQEEIDRDAHEYFCARGPRFRKLLAMLKDMEGEGYFEKQPFPISLHHCDLEPRNLMVSKASGAWKITGIIDWDDAVALPAPLARVPPRWIWHFPDKELDLEDGYLNDDQYPDPELSDENKALKAYFDAKVETVLPGYAEDAYGYGRWLRRIWLFAKEGASREWQWPFLDQIPEEWAARPKRS